VKRLRTFLLQALGQRGHVDASLHELRDHQP
jgi:hypothetical protein